MKRFYNGKSSTGMSIPRWASLVMSVVMIWAVLGLGSGGAQAAGSSNAGSGAPTVPTVTCPGGQCFEDVPSTNPFYSFINALYIDGIISGYLCSVDPEPCVAPNNRPYYRPNNNVTRAQMAKFVDNGRRNIADAIGNSLFISTTVYTALEARTTSGGYAVHGRCTAVGTNCWAIAGSAASGDRAGVLSGGRGVYVTSDDASYAALDAHAYGATAYGGQFLSDQYVSLYVKAPPANNGFIQLRVDGVGGTLIAERIVNGGLDVQGNLTVSGSKTGYVVDAMQNVDSSALEAGDVVVIAGNSAPVLGEIPVVTVKRATTAYDTGVVGIVDQVLYVPNASMKATYEAQQNALSKATAQRDAADKKARADGTKPDYSGIEMPQITVNDEQGTVHAIAGATQVAVGGYANVVTLGSYKAVKVDASFGPVHAGDLLVASTHAGYAMKATDRSLTSGATIGKALGNLETGSGLVPVMVTLK